ncbi:MAG: ABC transporter permease [Acidobacteria bacterium]|nr:ABC transporter permease [Acidobacteriota bacterium]
MRDFFQDLRFGILWLRQRPGFASAAVFTLALGIGACTAIFSVINTVLLNPLPYEQGERLVLLWETTKDMPGIMVSYPDYLDWREQNRVFESLGVFNRYHSANLTGTGEPERLSAALGSASVFEVLRVKPALGRNFLPGDDLQGAERVAVLGSDFWRRKFGADPSAVGRSLNLDGQPYTIVGVLPSGVRFGSNADVWLPLGQFVDEGMMNRGNHPGLLGIGRLKPGVTLEAARAQMSALAGSLEKQYPASNHGVGVGMDLLIERVVGNVRPTLLALLGSVAFVLLIACSNVANLLLSRSVSRQREMAIRGALGARRGRLVRQLLTESLVLALLGGALGLGLAVWSVDLIRGFGSSVLPRASDIAIEPRILAATLAVSLLTGLLFGLAPALQISGDAHDALRGGGRATAGPAKRRMRAMLVAGEVALSLMLLIGAGLMANSFVRLLRVPTGFDPADILTAQVSLPEKKYPQNEQMTSFYREAVERMRSLPGVEAAAAAYPVPFGEGGWQVGLEVEGHPVRSPGDYALINSNIATPDYFKTLRIPLTSGRVFTEQDSRESEKVTVVNQAFVRRFWPGEDPIGKKLRMGGEPNAAWFSVVGVVGDVRRDSLASPLGPEIHFAVPQLPQREMTLLARVASSPEGLVPALREAVKGVDPDQPLYAVTSLEARLSDSLDSQRFALMLIGIFAGVALLLAWVGIYGVVAYTVSHRTHEIGLRMALGARRRDIARMVVQQGMTPALVGLGLGLLGSLGITPLISSLLYGIEPTDPVTLFGAVIVLATAALLAGLLPARRAAKVDPMIALRVE